MPEYENTCTECDAHEALFVCTNCDDQLCPDCAQLHLSAPCNLMELEE